MSTKRNPNSSREHWLQVQHHFVLLAGDPFQGRSPRAHRLALHGAAEDVGALLGAAGDVQRRFDPPRQRREGLGGEVEAPLRSDKGRRELCESP